jgi:GT2 family glycosyltransferase
MHDKYHSIDVDIVGPDVISTLNGQHQNPYIPERISRKKMEFFRDISSNILKYNTFLLAYYLKNKLVGLVQKAARSYEKGREVYSIHGSFMVFSNHFFEKGGHFTYGSFLFGEEIFVGEIARMNNLRVVYDPAFRIIHREHATTGIFKKASHVKFMHDSYSYILATYY